MTGMDKLASELKSLLAESDSRKPQAYDTTATVVRVDDDENILWVHIPGGVDETPIKKTINAREGDSIQLRVANGTAWITGNESAPPTDDRVAIKATNIANDADIKASLAKNAADNALLDAERANVAANQAQADAQRANLSATEASNSATIARDAAGNAQESADTALNQLGIVEDVVGVLDLVTKNGEYDLTEDTTVNTDKWYFIRSLTLPYTYSVVNEPSSSFIYILSSDTEIDPSKTYYTRSDSEPYVYTEVEEPTGSPVENNYYEYTNSPKANGFYELVDVKEAIRNYVTKTLALTDDGLYLKSAINDGWKVLIKQDGVDIINGANPIASYSSYIKLGGTKSYTLITEQLMQFYLLNRVMALFGYDEEFESYGVKAENVMIKGAGNALRLDNGVNGTYQGQYILETRANGHLSLKPGLSRTEEV